MKKIYYFLLLGGLTLTLPSCGEGEGADDNNTDAAADSSAVTEEMTEEEPESEGLAFDGVEKGEYMLYGHSEMDASESGMTVNEMMASINETGGFDGKVNVKIDEVCKKAGCWITFENGEETPIRVFFRDHFTIPTETASGTEAILMGQAVVDTLTVDFQKHLLDDAAEAGQEVAQSEYDAITADKIETTFDCEAILVRKG